jgi:amidase
MIRKNLAGKLLAITAPLACLTFASTGAIHAQTLKSFELETATLADVQEVMEMGALTSVELVLLYKNRIAAYDDPAGAIGLNTIPVLSPLAIAEAARADRLRRQGTVLSPLHGVPFTTKGNYNFAGLPTTNGLTVWADFVAPYTAFVIEKLQESGAIFLGHNNLDTFQSSTASSNSQTFGLARNAYNRAFNTGGSSGGSGSSVGANLTFFSLGGETGGSVRSPGDRAGIVGYKTSQSVISVRGLAPLAWDRDVVGPMTRYAIDNAKVMDVVSQLDPEDIWSQVVVLEDRPRPSGFAEKAETQTLSGVRIGVLTNSVSTSTAATAVAIKDEMAGAIADMEAAGATVIEVTAPSTLDITFTGRRNSLPESVETPPARRLYSPVTSDLTGNMVAGSRAYAFLKFLESMVTEEGDTAEEIYDKVVARISPVTQLPVQYRNAIIDQTTFGPTHPDSVEHYLAVRYQILDYELFLEENNLDALIFPTVTTKTSTALSLPPLTRAWVNSFNLPCVTIPMGTITIGDSVEPVTLCFLGRNLQDDRVLAIAAAYEAVSNKRIVSPQVPPLMGENFDITLEDFLALNPIVNPPLVVAPSRAAVRGGRANRQFVVAGRLRTAAPVESVQVWVNGQLMPVSLRRNAWTAGISVDEARTFITPGDQTANFSILVRDVEGNTNAISRTIRLPRRI